MPRPNLFFLAGQSLPRCDHRIDKYFTAYQTLQFMTAGDVTLSVGKQTYALSGRHAWSGFAGPRVSFRPTNPGQTWRTVTSRFAGLSCGGGSTTACSPFGRSRCLLAISKTASTPCCRRSPTPHAPPR
ncbi:MAG: hypothetical protein QM754_03175 [Tepidisphaeraceae bacterium]